MTTATDTEQLKSPKARRLAQMQVAKAAYEARLRASGLLTLGVKVSQETVKALDAIAEEFGCPNEGAAIGVLADLYAPELISGDVAVACEPGIGRGDVYMQRQITPGAQELLRSVGRLPTKGGAGEALGLLISQHMRNPQRRQVALAHRISVLTAEIEAAMAARDGLERELAALG